MNKLRPIQHLNAAIKLYPETGKNVDMFRADRGRDLPMWPDWCFLPMAAWYSIVSAENGTNTLPLHLVADVSKLAAIGTWRYSQGVYQIDHNLMSALIETPVTGSLPSDIFHRLPEWSIYIETPGLTWGSNELNGFWAHLEWDVNTAREELRLLLDCKELLIPVILHLGKWTITESVNRAVSEASKQAANADFDMSLSQDTVQIMAEEINPLVSLLLYICSDEPEIDDSREPGIAPNRPNAKKTKKGWRLFPADKPRFWAVGTRTGASLRNASLGDPTGRSVKTHLRRGHWHGFWTGPQQGERKFIYKWISPIVVSGKS